MGLKKAHTCTTATAGCKNYLTEETAMEVIKTKLKSVLLIKPDVFEDHRGEYVETYN